MSLAQPLSAVPPGLARYRLRLVREGTELVYDYDDRSERGSIADLLHDLGREGIAFHDLHTTQSSLEEIFVGLVGSGKAA